MGATPPITAAALPTRLRAAVTTPQIIATRQRAGSRQVVMKKATIRRSAGSVECAQDPLTLLGVLHPVHRLADAGRRSPRPAPPVRCSDGSSPRARPIPETVTRDGDRRIGSPAPEPSAMRRLRGRQTRPPGVSAKHCHTSAGGESADEPAASAACDGAGSEPSES